MQEVSTAWKQAQRQTIVPESYVKILMNIGDPDAQLDASASDDGHVIYSDVTQTVDETDKDPQRYTTLEHNMWLLDGTWFFLPDKAPYGNNGYIGSAISKDDCTYEVTPTITISFSQVYTATLPGITIAWGTAYEEYADSFRITAYNGSTIVAQQTVENNTAIQSDTVFEITNYNKIKIEVLKWCLPGRRARIEKIVIGIEKIYSKTDLMSFQHSMSVSPLSAELPKADVVFEITNLNGEYNPDNPQGTEKFLMERQKITVQSGYKLNNSVEWIKTGTFYMSEWDTPQNGITATFTARDVLEFMNDVYTGTISGTLYDIAIAAITQAGLPELLYSTQPYIVDASLKNIAAPDTVELDEDTTIAEVLQYVANAACCVMYQDRDGILHIEPLASGETDYVIDQYVSYENSEISLTKQLKAVDVNNGQYILSVGSVGETQTIKNPFISDSRAETVANWAADYLQNRKTLSGEFRADPRLDALDRVTNSNQFADTVVLVTEITYTYNGAFRGSYAGRAGV